MESNSEFIEHKPCPCGLSSDALGVYSDGHSFCFRCHKTFNGKEKQIVQSNFVDGVVQSLDKRKISEETCRKFGYTVGKYHGKTVQVAPYYLNNKLVAQKIRYPNKDFIAVGNLKDAELFGQHLFKAGGKRIVVTEGEIDCLSVAEAFKGWPVVSVKNGAGGALKSIKQQIEYLETFDQVIFMFDEDDVGKRAAKQCAELLSPSKAYIASLPRKDPNDMLLHGEVKELVQCIFNAKESRPDGIINGSDTWKEVSKPIEMGTLYPFSELNHKTYGLRKGELVTICAGSGVGKSAFVSELAYHLAFHHQDNVGYIALEENIGRTARRFMGINLNKPIHLPNQEVSEDELRNAFQNTMGKQKIWLYDHWGSLDSDNLLSKMRYLVKACDCKWLILDHLSIVISGMELDGDERRMLDKCMTMLRSFAEETNCGLLIVSHLRRPQAGRSHEEGLMPSLSDLRSSHSIAQLSDMVLALGRNSQSDNDEERNTTQVRILKNRFSGETGAGCALHYSQVSGRLEETDYSFDEF
tara:strand:- start:3558 stop:5132 length:1575 start_codon:yes stop_codon:yes gene_type:complete